MAETATYGIVGRDEELAAVAAFLDAAESGSALLLEGEAGIGKTTVWQGGVVAAERRGRRVLRARPSESEAALSFSGLADLLADTLDDVLPELPSPQRRALEAALLLADAGEAQPEQRAVAAAVLGALRALSGRGPVTIAVDDIQWLDGPSAAALEFAVRRVRDEPIELLLTRRLTGQDPPLGLEQAAGAGRLHRVAVGPLRLGALYRMLHERLGVVLSRPALRRAQELSGGNALFALELAREPERLARGSELPRSVAALIDRGIGALPEETRVALGAAAAASQPTVALAEDVAHAPGALAAAETAHVIEVDAGRIRFTHPLLASGAYGALDAVRRRKAHRRLGELVHDPEERARHLAHAATGPDDAVASALETAAVRARGRGAPAAAAELLEQAARLTPPDRATDIRRRLVDAAYHHFESGDSRRARELLERLMEEAPAGPERARVMTRLARVRSYDDDQRAAAELFIQAVEEAGENRVLKAQAHEGAASVLFRLRERLPESVGHGRSAVALARALGEERALATTLGTQLLAEATVGLVEARATHAELLAQQPPMESMRILDQPKFAAAVVGVWWDDLEAASVAFEELLARCGEIGDESSVPYVLALLGQAECLLGAFARAADHADEGQELAAQAGQGWLESFLLALRAMADAYIGAADRTRDEAKRALAVAMRVNGTPARYLATAALGLLELSLGRAREAADVLGPLVAFAREQGVSEPGMTRFALDHVEALIELGQLDEAAELLDWYESHAVRLGRHSALANASRCRGLLAAASGDDPLSALERALAEHELYDVPYDHARTLLAYGAALRRTKRKRDARAALDEALARFEELGAAAFAERARGELARIGGRISAADELTATEQRVVELVADGRTNREVAAALFLTTKTIEFHLRNVFRKLEIRSRAELVKRYR